MSGMIKSRVFYLGHAHPFGQFISDAMEKGTSYGCTLIRNGGLCSSPHHLPILGTLEEYQDRSWRDDP